MTEKQINRKETTDGKARDVQRLANVLGHKASLGYEGQPRTLEAAREIQRAVEELSSAAAKLIGSYYGDIVTEEKATTARALEATESINAEQPTGTIAEAIELSSGDVTLHPVAS